jgi:hypothetical protein
VFQDQLLSLTYSKSILKGCQEKVKGNPKDKHLVDLKQHP